MNTTTDLLLLRWRTAQWFLALSDGEEDHARSVLAAMRIEIKGLQTSDIVDEFKLLRAEFGRRARYHLVIEINRLFQKLKARP